jgi:hypothetical protein
MQYCLKDFGKALGLTDTLSFTDGLLTLRDDEGVHWMLQCPDDAGLLVVYSPLTAWGDASQQEAENWLRLNSRFDILRGAWVGLHPENQIFCLFASIPLSILTGPLLYNLFMNLQEVRATLALRLNQPGYGFASSA